jgi:DNA-directed RNA polymerase subunit RPC12/RpoP
MEILSHWKGIKVPCTHCGAEFTFEAKDVRDGKLFTESDAMLRVLKSGIGTVLFTFCPACEHRVLLSPTMIPQFYKDRTTVKLP